jgi:diguanylate cyclase (GGDEF)-like protein
LNEAKSKLTTAARQAEKIAEMAVNNLREVRHSNKFDALTHTANRALMFDRVAMAMASAREHGNFVAILSLDIDHFRHINATLGHAGGDAILKIVASRVGCVLGKMDVMSRHGGDEFLVLLHDVADAVSAAIIAQSIMSTAAMPITLGDAVLNISVSLGIAMYPRDGTDIESLIERAGRAMYLSKSRGAGGFQFIKKWPPKTLLALRLLLRTPRPPVFSGTNRVEMLDLWICVTLMSSLSWPCSPQRRWRNVRKRHISSRLSLWRWWRMNCAAHLRP